jgi:hypothetical protein
MSLWNLASRISIGVLLLSMCRTSYGRCAPSSAYETVFEIHSCEDKDPNDRSRVLGYGAILEVNVLSTKKIESGVDWWQSNNPLPTKMKVFYDKNNATCASFEVRARRRGVMRQLCCDGAEPRCNFGTSVAVYDLTR